MPRSPSEISLSALMAGILYTMTGPDLAERHSPKLLCDSSYGVASITGFLMSVIGLLLNDGF
jgi:hypothetical protein